MGSPFIFYVRDSFVWRNNCGIQRIDLSTLGDLKKQHEKLLRGHGSKESFIISALLRSCARTKDIHEGTRLHCQILKRGLLENNPYLVSALVSMYAKCGCLENAQQVLEQLPVASRDVASWNALIAGYSSAGRTCEAFIFFEQMQREGLIPDPITVTCILKACSNVGEIERGKKIHGEMINRGFLETDIILGTTLVDMYVKCGLMAEARQVIEELPVRDVATWSVLIAGYNQQGQAHEALTCFQWMQSEGVAPDVITFTCALKACGSLCALGMGEHIHGEILRERLLEKDIIIGTALVDMYVKCGMLEKAQQTLQALPNRDLVSWFTVISGFIQQGQWQKSLNCFEQMQSEGIPPDAITFACILKACGSTGAIDKGKQIHIEVVRLGMFRKDITIGNALLDMYAKCGMLKTSEQVFMELPSHSVVSWNMLCAGYVQCGKNCEVLKLFEQMQAEAFSPDVITMVCVLKVCGNVGAIMKGKQIHCCGGFLNKNLTFGNSLVDMYAKCGSLERAQNVFKEITRDVVSWNILISGYIQHGQYLQGLHYFERMQSEGHCPDIITFVWVLKACGNVRAVAKGKEIHNRILSEGLLEKSVLVGNALVDMYAKFGMRDKAEKVLKELPVQDVISWSALIAEYVQQKQGEDALRCFEQMQSEGLSPDLVTYASILKACGSIKAKSVGKRIHKDILDKGLLNKDIILSNALVDFYVKCGMLTRAHELLKEIPYQDVATWNAVIAGYAQQGYGHEALNYFENMKKNGHVPDEITFVCILKACGSTGAMNKGKEIHDEIVHRGLLEKDFILGNALIDMYAKCGSMTKAQEVHKGLLVRDLASWNALIAGYAKQGQGCEALECLEQMQNEGLSPDKITSLCALSACSHAGLLVESRILFSDITKKFAFSADSEHHTCMVMAFGHAGQFDEAMSVMQAMPSLNCSLVWLALLSACRKWGNVKLGILAFDQIVQLDYSCSSAYVLIADIFASSSRKEDAERVRSMKF